MNEKLSKSLRSGTIIGLVLFVLITAVGATHVLNALWVSALGAFLIAGSLYFFFIPSGGGKNTTVILENGEKALMREGASYFTDGEEIGGMLYLTETMLIFKSDVMSLRRIQRDFFLRDVEDVRTVKNYGRVDNGLEVDIKFDKTHRFGVKNNTRWMERIEEKMD
jgi:hypothetical protein